MGVGGLVVPATVLAELIVLPLRMLSSPRTNNASLTDGTLSSCLATCMTALSVIPPTHHTLPAYPCVTYPFKFTLLTSSASKRFSCPPAPKGTTAIASSSS